MRIKSVIGWPHAPQAHLAASIMSIRSELLSTSRPHHCASSASLVGCWPQAHMAASIRSQRLSTSRTPITAHHQRHWSARIPQAHLAASLMSIRSQRLSTRCLHQSVSKASLVGRVPPKLALAASILSIRSQRHSTTRPSLKPLGKVLFLSMGALDDMFG